MGEVDLGCELSGPPRGEVAFVVSDLIDTIHHWSADLIWRLADAGYRMLRLDTRDYGRSTWLDGRERAAPNDRAPARLGAPVLCWRARLGSVLMRRMPPDSMRRMRWKRGTT